MGRLSRRLDPGETPPDFEEQRPESHARCVGRPDEPGNTWNWFRTCQRHSRRCSFSPRACCSGMSS